jgi:hypothetical protein
MTFSDIVDKSKYSPTSLEFANELDTNNKLSKYRNEFAIPTRRMVSGENPVIGK